MRLAAPVRRRNAEKVLVVYNGLSWRRSGLVAVEGLPANLRQGPLVAVDLASGEVFPCEDIPGTARQVVFFARDVPSIGYRLYMVEPAAEGLPVPQGDFQLQSAWNDSGTLTSILDPGSGREMLLQDSERKFGALYTALERKEYFEARIGPAKARVAEGPISRRVEFVRTGSALPLTILTTYRDAAYADLAFDVDLSVLQDETANHQASAIALPLATGQDMFVDGAGFVSRIPQDLLPGSESPQNTTQHFTHLQRTSEWGVTVANRDAFCLRPDMLFLAEWEDLYVTTREEGLQRLYRGEPRGSPVQRFRFRLATQPANPGECKRMGAETNLPLQALLVEAGEIPPVQEFFLLNDPDIRLLAFKPAQIHRGWYMLRLQEIAGGAATGVQLRTPLSILEAKLASTVEAFTGADFDLSNFSMEPWQTRTVLVQIRKSEPQEADRARIAA